MLNILNTGNFLSTTGFNLMTKIQGDMEAWIYDIYHTKNVYFLPGYCTLRQLLQSRVLTKLI